MADRLGCAPVIRLAFSIMPIAVLAFGLAPNITMAYCVFCPSWLLLSMRHSVRRWCTGSQNCWPAISASLLALPFGSTATHRLAALLSLLLALLPANFRPAYAIFFCLAGFADWLPLFHGFWPGNKHELFRKIPPFPARCRKNAGLMTTISRKKPAR